MQTLDKLLDLKDADIGKWLRLGGMGIVDGLKGKPFVEDVWELTRILRDKDGVVTEIGIRKYRGRRRYYISEQFNYLQQKAEVWESIKEIRVAQWAKEK